MIGFNLSYWLQRSSTMSSSIGRWPRKPWLRITSYQCLSKLILLIISTSATHWPRLQIKPSMVRGRDTWRLGLSIALVGWAERLTPETTTLSLRIQRKAWLISRWLGNMALTRKGVVSRWRAEFKREGRLAVVPHHLPRRVLPGCSPQRTTICRAI